MKTKILDTARRLFNEKGFSQISLRMLADELDISPGNLTYHYKKKDDIVMALYEEFVATTNESFSKVEAARDDLLERIMDTTWLFYKVSWEYRFFMVEWVYFMQQYAVMREHFTALMNTRREQFRISFENMRSQQMMQPEMVEGYDEDLIDTIFLIGNFWISQELSLCNNKTGEEAINKGVKSMINLFIPLFEPAYRIDVLKAMEGMKPYPFRIKL